MYRNRAIIPARDPARDAAPAAGQIRLLHPLLAPPDAGPVFLLVLEATPAGFLVAPFSRFVWPALPGELLTGRPELPVRVLCLWRAGAVPGALLTRSWKVGKVRAADLRDSLAVLQQERSGVTLAPKLADRTGAPLWSVLDPRHDYVAEERDRTAFLDRQSPAGETGLEWNGRRLDSAPLDKAAEPPEDYETR